MRILRKLFLVGGVGLGCLAGLLAALWLDHTRPTVLPPPTGSFAVGRTLLVWRDTAQAPLAPPGMPRELVAWLWYPAAPDQPGQARAEYLPAPWRTALQRHMGILLTQFLTRDLARVQGHSWPDAALARQQPAYPVVLLRAGLAALTTQYTTLAEDLASHGYLVVGVDAPYRSLVVVFPDGRVIPRAAANNADGLNGPAQEQLATHLVAAWSQDLRFTLTQLDRLNVAAGPFRGRLDLQRVGVVGHSLGGATALQFCHDEARCRAGIDIDGAPLGPVIGDGVTQPFLFLLSDHRREPVAETRVVEANMRAIYARLPANRRRYRTLRGATHFGFSDDGALLKIPLAMRALRALGVGPVEGRRQLAWTAQEMHTFFDAYLKGAPDPAP